MVLSIRGASHRRDQHKDNYWSDLDGWLGQHEKGWFACPRTLPLFLALMNSKAISNKANPSSVYLELISRTYGEGVVEMVQEEEHAYNSGYSGNRAVRSWQERMDILEKNGFINTVRVNGRRKFAFILHPVDVVHKLRQEKKVPADWWNAYQARQVEVKEPDYETRAKARLTRTANKKKKQKSRP
jgi:hypothetical protein